MLFRKIQESKLRSEVEKEGKYFMQKPFWFFRSNVCISVLLNIHCQTFSVAFKIYDMDKDGYISNGELYQVLKMMVGNNLKDHQLQQIVDKTIIHADSDGDGKISFEEFCAVRLVFTQNSVWTCVRLCWLYVYSLPFEKKELLLFCYHWCWVK